MDLNHEELVTVGAVRGVVPPTAPVQVAMGSVAPMCGLHVIVFADATEKIWRQISDHLRRVAGLRRS